MDNQRRDNELELIRFGEYLLKSRIVAEKYAPYYVRWVRKFMAQATVAPGLGIEDRITAYLDWLRGNVEPAGHAGIEWRRSLGSLAGGETVGGSRRQSCP